MKNFNEEEFMQDVIKKYNPSYVCASSIVFFDIEDQELKRWYDVTAMFGSDLEISSSGTDIGSVLEKFYFELEQKLTFQSSLIDPDQPEPF